MKPRLTSFKFIVVLFFITSNVFSGNDSINKETPTYNNSNNYLQLSRIKSELNSIEIDILYDDNYSGLSSKLLIYEQDVNNIKNYFKDEKNKYYSYRLLKSLYSYIDDKGKDISKLKKSITENNANIISYNNQLRSFQPLLQPDSIVGSLRVINPSKSDVISQLNKLGLKTSTIISQYERLENYLLSIEINLLSIKENIRIRLKNTNNNFFAEGKTYKDTIQTISVFQSLNQSSLLSHRILSSYINERYSSFIFMLLFILFGLFIHYKISYNKNIADAITNSYAVLNKSNNLSVFYVLFLLSVIIPYFFSNTPILLAELFMTTSGFILTVLVFKSNTLFRKYKYAWTSFFIVFRLLAVINVIVFSYKYETNIWLILNFLSLLIGLAFILIAYKAKSIEINRVIIFIFSIFIAFTLFAIIANITNCHTLSRLLTIGSVFTTYSIVVFYFFNNYFRVFINYYVDSLRKKLPVYFENEIKGINLIFLFGIKLFSILSVLLIIIHAFSLDFLLLGKLDTILNQNFTTGTYSFSIYGILLVLFILIVTFTITRLIGFYLDYYSNIRIRKNFSYKLIVKLIIYFSGFYLIIMFLGLSSNNLSVLIGALGFGIGFGLQSIIANFTAGLLLILEGRVKIDDFVEISGKNGIVKEINGRSVRLYTQDGSDILVPNTEFIGQNVKNWSLSNSLRMIDIVVVLDYSNSVEQITKILSDILLPYDLPEISYQSKVYVLGLDEGGIKVVCHVWIRNHQNSIEIKSEIIQLICGKFNELGIKFKSSK